VTIVVDMRVCQVHLLNEACLLYDYGKLLDGQHNITFSFNTVTFCLPKRDVSGLSWSHDMGYDQTPVIDTLQVVFMQYCSLLIELDSFTYLVLPCPRSWHLTS